MLTSILSFFKPNASSQPEANISEDFVEVPSEPLPSEPLPSEDYIIVELNDETAPLQDETVPLQIESTARQEILPKPRIEQEQVVSKPETSRHELWKMRNPKIFKKFTDASGQVHEIRYVNYDKQLAFWDPKTKKQKNVYRSQVEDPIDLRIFGC